MLQTFFYNITYKLKNFRYMKMQIINNINDNIKKKKNKKKKKKYIKKKKKI